ncbi:hypothetical protein GCM10009118_07490 [Wandonia haliotis]|uniref:Lipoprotein n=1 Tax=Wandonia haliotis TaxID=574963 RepID=A0ABN1MM37_9FLAO
MGFYINRWKLICLVLLPVVLYSCAIVSQKEKTVIRQGYYFIVQINSINKDTISFYTVDIYTPFKIVDLDIYDNDGNLISSSEKFLRLCERNYNQGYLKGLDKKNIGEILILSINPSSGISDDGFIIFNKVENQSSINLSNFYVFPKNCY